MNKRYSARVIEDKDLTIRFMFHADSAYVTVDYTLVGDADSDDEGRPSYSEPWVSELKLGMKNLSSLRHFPFLHMLPNTETDGDHLIDVIHDIALESGFDYEGIRVGNTYHNTPLNKFNLAEVRDRWVQIQNLKANDFQE